MQYIHIRCIRNTHTYTRMYVWMCVCVYVSMKNVSMYVCMCVCVYEECKHVCAYAYKYVCACKQVCIRVCMHSVRMRARMSRANDTKHDTADLLPIYAVQGLDFRVEGLVRHRGLAADFPGIGLGRALRLFVRLFGLVRRQLGRQLVCSWLGVWAWFRI